MSTNGPEKIHLIPDETEVVHVGKLPDGTLYFVDSQLSASGDKTDDYVCTFVFDADGRLVRHAIDLVGTRGSYTDAQYDEVFAKHLATIDGGTEADIWVRPFTVEAHGQKFGFVASLIEDAGNPPTDDDWRVWFVPGNTLAFYAPWDAGGYEA